MVTVPMDPAAAFGELSRIKLGDMGLDGVLTRVAELARHTVPGAEQVSVTLIRDGRARTVGATDPVALAMDERQYERGAGPCLDASAWQRTVHVPDVATDNRWPDWAVYARFCGMRSSLAVGLTLEDPVRGSLNLYAAEPHAFDDEAVQLAETFASYAAVALANAHLYHATRTFAEHLHAAMESRAVIEQAKGIILSQRACTPDEAFAILAKASQRSNRKVRDMAAALVEQAARRSI